MDLIIQDYKNRLTWFLRNLQKNPIPTLVVDRVFGVTDKTVSKHRIFRVVGFRDSLCNPFTLDPGYLWKPNISK